jgi:hypothetical protein
MQRVLYSIEDYLEDWAHELRAPWWLRRLVRSLARTVGGFGDLIALR